ncbi:MAG: FAD-dependent thymidylate synthase [Planctomycetota bacterium]
MLPARSYVWWVEQLLDFFPERKARLQEVQSAFKQQNETSYALYKDMLTRGVAREIARCVLPLSMYTEWYWKVDLHNLFHFLRLRMDPHAQLEVRELAEAMAFFVQPKVPLAWEAFERDRRQAVFLSREEKEVLSPVDEESSRTILAALHEKGYRARRLKETSRKLGIDERLVDDMFPPKES